MQLEILINFLTFCDSFTDEVIIKSYIQGESSANENDENNNDAKDPIISRARADTGRVAENKEVMWHGNSQIFV